MSAKWIVAIILAMATHFSASYLVPLDDAAKKTFSGLLGSAWPWAYGDHGLLGRISQDPNGLPMTGLFIAITSATLLLMALLAVLHWWIPFGWWKPCAAVGAALSIVLMLSFFGPNKSSRFCCVHSVPGANRSVCAGGAVTLNWRLGEPPIRVLRGIS